MIDTDAGADLAAALRADRTASIVLKSTFSDLEMTLPNREITGFLCDAVPKGLQTPDLLGLWQFAEAGGAVPFGL